jgi:polysaccharide chain length determinant protein (PEP-CTERM system associated)
MAEETRTGINLASVLAIWSRRKWLAIFAFAAVASATATVTAVLPKIYQSTATILVVGQQVPPDFVRPLPGTLDTRLQAINQEILSRSRLEELINRFDLYPNRQEVGPDVLIERMRRDIEVKPAGTGGGPMIGFTVRYSGRDPQTVALVTNTIASYYIEENMKVRERQATGTADFLKVQLGQVKGRLETQERHVSEFKRRYLGELPTQLEPNLATLERLNTQFRVNAEKQMRAKEQRQELARMIDSMNSIAPAPTPSGSPKPQAAAAHAPAAPDPNAVRLFRMKQEYKDMLNKYSSRYPDVIQLKQDIEALERQVQDAARERQAAEAAAAEAKRQSAAAEAAAAKVKEEKVASRDPYVVQMEEALSQLAVEITALKEEEAKLRADMATYQLRVDNTPRRDLEFQELSRDYGSTRELYNTLLKRYEEAQLSENLEQRQKGEQFRILEPAVAAGAPVAPNRPRLLLAGLGLSLALAVGLVILAEQLDTSFHNIDELRAITSFPVLVSIPRIVTEGDVRRTRWRAALVAAVAVCCLTLVVGASYFVTKGNENLVRLVSGRL